ncbi:MAG: hypothetical protein AAB536_02375 [Patescibacteria group bacterium]
MKKITPSLLLDVAKYSFIWALALGATTVFIIPFYNYLLDTIGGWIYLIFIILGILTKVWFSFESKE